MDPSMQKIADAASANHSVRLTADEVQHIYTKQGLSPAVDHLAILHRVLYGTIDDNDAFDYLYSHLRKDADLADFGRPLKFQYQPYRR